MPDAFTEITKILHTAENKNILIHQFHFIIVNKV